MITLDERMRAASDALGDAPRHAPPFSALMRRRQRRQRARAVAGAAVSIAIVCTVAVALVATRHDAAGPAPAGSSTPTSAAAPTTRTTLSFSGRQSLASMPRLPASSVHTVSLSRPVGQGPAVFAGGSLWVLDPTFGCGSCPWLFRIDPATGTVSSVKTPSLGAADGNPLAIGAGAAFVTTFDYRGDPARLLAVDLATGQKRFSVPVPGTSVQGNPKFRIAVGAGGVWVSEGDLPVTEFDARTGAVLARVHLPQQGAETACCPGTVFDGSGLWLVGGNSGTALMRVDPQTRTAAIVLDWGPGFTQSLAADNRRVWATHYAGSPARLDLVRVDLDHPTRLAAGIPTPLVADGGGEVWFAGYEPGMQADDPRNHDGAIGRVDPVSLKVIGVTELRGIGNLTEVQLFADSGGAWVYLPGQGTITRIADPVN